MADKVKRQGSSAVLLACCVILFGFYLTYFTFIERGDMGVIELTGFEAPRSQFATDPFPNLLFGPLFVLSALAVHVLIRRMRPRTDPFLFSTIVFLSGLGFLLLYRLSPDLPVSKGALINNLARKHFLWLEGGFLLTALIVVFLKRRHVHWFERKKYVLFLTGSTLIMYTALFTGEINNRNLWISAFGFTIQTIEPVKLLYAMGLASFFAEYSRYIHPGKFMGRRFPEIRFAGPFFIVSLISILPVVFQKDFGPTALLTIVFTCGLYVGAGLSSLPILWFSMVPLVGWISYRLGFPSMVRTRVTMWLDPFGYGESMARSFWALSSGRLWGARLGFGRPPDIPVVQSECNVTAICEDLGDKAGMGKYYNNMGSVAASRGGYDEAMKLYRRALAILNEMGDKAAIGT